MSLPTTGQYCEKLYRCSVCGFEKKIGTNHYGECYGLGNYNNCPKCPPFRRPTTWICGEEPPAGMGKPEPWKRVEVEIKLVKTKRKVNV